MTRWVRGRVAEVREQQKVSVLPLREPLEQPVVLEGSAARVWEVVVAAGADGIDLDGLAEAIAPTLPAGSVDEAHSLAVALVPFLDGLAERGVLDRLPLGADRG